MTDALKLADTVPVIQADREALDHIWDGLAKLNDAKHPAWAGLAHVNRRLTHSPAPSSDAGKLVEALARLNNNLSCAPPEAEKCFVSLDDHRTILAALSTPSEAVGHEIRCPNCRIKFQYVYDVDAHLAALNEAEAPRS